MNDNYGPCAKTVIRCTIIATSGEVIVGENWCENPQEVCPRTFGEGYEKCKTICKQLGHAEEVAVKLAGAKALGAAAYLEGHTYACMDCQHSLFDAGIKTLSIGTPITWRTLMSNLPDGCTDQDIDDLCRDEEKPWQPLSMAKRAEPSIMELMEEMHKLCEEAVELGK